MKLVMEKRLAPSPLMRSLVPVARRNASTSGNGSETSKATRSSAPLASAAAAAMRTSSSVRALAVIGDAPMREDKGRPLTGTEVTFYPSVTTFSHIDFDLKTLEHRLRELAFLNSGVRIILEDERHAEPLRTELFYEGGVREFVKFIDRSKTPVMPEPKL